MQMRDLCSNSLTFLLAVTLFLAGAAVTPRPAWAQTASPQVEPAPPAATSPSPTQPGATTRTLTVGDMVQSTSGGPVMRVQSINGDQANCQWRDKGGKVRQERFSVAQLTVTAAPMKNEYEFEEPAPYHPCPANVITRNGRHECLR